MYITVCLSIDLHYTKQISQQKITSVEYLLLYINYDRRKWTSVAVIFHQAVPLQILVPAIYSPQFVSNRIFKIFIFGRASNIYLYLYNQLFALFH